MAKKQFKTSDIWGVLKESGSEWVEDKAPKMAAALAYYTAISIAPLIIITMKIVGLFFMKQDQASHLLNDQLTNLTGPQVATLTTAINTTSKPGAGVLATGISIVIALLGASGVFGELQDSLNTIWEVRPKPNRGIKGIISDRFLSMTMVLGIAFMLLVSMFITTIISGVSTSTIHTFFGGDGRFMQHVLKGTNVVLSIVIITLLFAAIFRFLPDVKISWSDVWLGAFVTAFLFEAGKFALSEYFTRGTPTSAYGAAGSLVAVLLWVYYSAYILFFGAEFTQVYANQFGSHIVPAANAEALTEEMRARQGIPHADPATPGATPPTSRPRAADTQPGSRAPASPRPTVPRPTPRPQRQSVADSRGRGRAAGVVGKSYAGRYVPLLAAAVLARFVVKRYQEHHGPAVSLSPAPSAWKTAAKRWATRAALRSAVGLSKTGPGRALLRAGLLAKLQHV